ncbi:hypothetical protein L0156_16500 [bacterium]|nr:hypothetical protein [bacterium]
MLNTKLSIVSTPRSMQSLLGNSSSTMWVGALSFEERCVASLSKLSGEDLRVNAAVALGYSTQVNPSSDDQARRARNLEILSDLKSKAYDEEIRLVRIDAYSFQGLQDAMEDLIARDNPKFVIFDVSCMTKIHVLALAAMLSRSQLRFEWSVCYSIPENYGNLSEPHRKSGWRDIIVAPLAETALLFNEAHSRGIIMPGHEADRLILGLAELEPSGGLILLVNTPNRPDLRYLSERNNHKIMRQLTRLRSSDWVIKIVGLVDLDNLARYAKEQINIAKEFDAPVILFPYGPKLLLFFVALQLSSEYPEASWFVYPIPAAYDINYSEGIESTLWLVNETVETSHFVV